MAVLILKNGTHAGQLLNLPPGTVTMGRESDSSIRIPSTEVSRNHCSLTTTDNGIRVKDMGSKNGTFVNGEAIFDTILLKPYDILQVGPMEFEVAPPLASEVESAGESTIHQESDTTISGEESPTDSPSNEKKEPKSSSSKKHSKPAKRKRLRTEVTTDENIAEWLEEDHAAEPPVTHETTIITQADVKSNPELAALRDRDDAEPVIAPAKSPPRTKQPSDPVVQKAGEIIRRYWVRKRNG